MNKLYVYDRQLNLKNVIATDISNISTDVVSIANNTITTPFINTFIIDGDIVIVKGDKNYIGIVSEITKNDKTIDISYVTFLEAFNLDCVCENLSGTVYDFISEILNSNFVTIPDDKAQLPITIVNGQSASYSGTYTFDTIYNCKTMFMDLFYYNGTFLDFSTAIDEDGLLSSIVVTVKNINDLTVKKLRYDTPTLCNIKRTFTADQNKNKLILLPETDGGETVIFYLLKDGTLSTDQTAENRFENVNQTIKTYSSDATAEELVAIAEEELLGQEYNQNIQFDILRKTPYDLQIFDKVNFIDKDGTIYNSFVSKIIEYINYKTVTLGSVRRTLTDKLNKSSSTSSSTTSSGSSGSSYVLQKATSTTLGGIIASEKTTETNEVKIDPATGKLYASGVDSFNMDDVIDGETYVKTENNLSDTLKSNYDTAYTNTHTHSNKTILDNTTASYTTAEQTKLSAISGTNTGDQTSADFTLSGLSEKNFSSLTSKPTTLSGYGISDAHTKTEINTLLARKAVQPYIARNYSGGNGIRLIGTYDYSTSVGDTRPLFYLAGKQGHGNGTSYLWWGEFIFGVSTTGVVTAKAILKVSDGTYGKFYYRHDTVNKILYLYIYTGQYSSAYFSDLIQINAGNYSSYFTLASAGSVTSDTVTEGVNILYPASGGTIALSSQIPTITLNGIVTQTPNIYAPTSVGSSGQILISNGTGVSPSFQDSQILPPNTRSVWDGSSTAIPLLQNDSLANSESNPYLIDNAKKLAYLSANTSWGNDKYFKQTVDIDLDNRKYIPIEQLYYYDGNGCTIYNTNIEVSSLTISASSNFGFFSNALYLKNITLNNITITYSNVSITGSSGLTVSFGILCGNLRDYISTGSPSACFVENCSVLRGNMYITVVSSSAYTHNIKSGGVVGNLGNSVNNSYVTNCLHDGNITVNTYNTTNAIKVFLGGIIGGTSTSSFSGNVAKGYYYVYKPTTVGWGYVGGLCAVYNSQYTRENHNLAMIVCNATSTRTMNYYGQKAEINASNINASSWIIALGAGSVGGLESIVAKSLGRNGYIKYGSGLIIQWGEGILSGSRSFPINFTEVFAMVVTPTPMGSIQPYGNLTVYSLSNTGYNIRYGNSNSNDQNGTKYNFIAIGK